MKKSKQQSNVSVQNNATIQRSSRNSHNSRNSRNSRAVVSSLWDSSYSQSYKSTDAAFQDSHYGAVAQNGKNSRSSTSRSLPSGGSIRNSTFSKARVLFLEQFGCCARCYDSKILAVEPVVFLVMFAVYLHKIVYELYSFNHYAKIQIEGYPHGRDVCYRTSVLSNRSMTLKDYGYVIPSDYDFGDRVEDQTGKLFLTVGVSSGVLSMFGSFLLGPFSNYFGRKGALSFLTSGMILQAIFTTIIIECELHLYFFVLAFAFRSLTGNISGMYVIAFSYISEVSEIIKKKWHSVRIGLVETLTFLAVSLAFVIGGVTICKLDCNFEVLAYLSVACLLAAFMYGLIVTPEQYDEIYATSTSKSSSAPSPAPLLFTGPGSVLRGLGVMFRRTSPHLTMWLSLTVMMVTVANSTGMSAIITLFLLNRPLAWYPNWIGIYLGITEFVRGLVLVVVLPWLLSSGVHDITIVTLSMLLTAAMSVALGFVRQTWEILIVGVLLSGEVLVVPTLKAIMSKAVDPEDRSALVSFLSVAQLVSSVLGHVVYIPIYIHNWNYSHGRSTSFFVMATLYLFMLPLLLALGVMKVLKRRRSKLLSLLEAVVEDTDDTSYTVTPPTASTNLLASHDQPPVSSTESEKNNRGNGGIRRSTHRSSIEASIGQDVAQETLKDSWMLHSYSGVSEYLASR